MKKQTQKLIAAILATLALASCTVNAESYVNDPALTTEAPAAEGRTPEVPDETPDKTPPTETSVPLTPEDVELQYAQDEAVDGYYTEFVLNVRGQEIPFTGKQRAWSGSSEVFVEDFTGDGYPDIAVISTKDWGTGSRSDDIHVFDGITFKEYEVTDLTKTLTDHVSFSADAEAFIITTPDAVYRVNKSDAAPDPETALDKMYTGQYNRYIVSDGALHYIAGCMVSKGLSYHGEVDVTYKFDGARFVFGGASYSEDWHH